MKELLNRIFTNKSKKVLCLFDYKSFTGFATVSTNIKKELKAHFGQDLQLDIVAINYFGEPIEESDGSYVISALNSAPKKDDFGRFGFLKILKDSNEYDGIFIIQDLGVITKIIPILQGIKEHKKKNKQKSFKSMFYFPVDCKIIPSVIEGIEFFDCLVTYTEFGRKEVLKLKPELKGKLKVIPHGNNGNTFYPLPSSEVSKFRSEYFGENSNKLIITNVNRNQPRKDIPTTIFGFLEAKRRWKEEGLKNEPFLYLHMDGKDPMGWDLKAILMQTELEEGVDYMIFDTKKYPEGASLDLLNKIYNATDIYVTTTLGEGWGLTLTESMATKTPIICPLSTSFIEMTDKGNRVYALGTLLPFATTMDNVIREQCDFNEVADNIIHVAKGLSGMLEEFGFMDKHNQRIEDGYKWVKSLEWKEVCKQWIKYFKETY